MVLTPQGLPAPGLTVNLWPLFEGVDIRTARTDARGRFTFEEVPAVEHHFWVWNPERTAFGEATTDKKTSQGTVIRMESVSFLEGTVRDEQSRPLEGVRLRVNGQTLGDAPNQEALTDEAGHYRLGPLLASALDLFLTRAHFMNKEESIPRRDGVARTWDFTLARALSVEGSVVDTEGRPLAGVELRLSPTSVTSSRHRDGASQLDEHTVSDEAGRFLLDTEQEGPGRLFARATDFISTELDVKVPSTEVRVVLQQGASVSGTVVDAKGQPMTDVTLKLWDTTPASGDARTSTVDGQGGFSLRGLKAGHHVLEAWRRTPGMARSTSRPIELEEHTQAVVTLRFEEGRTLEGTTVDTFGQPVPGVQVRACLPLDDIPPWQLAVETCDPRSGGGVRSGPDGRFVLKHLVAPTYQLVAWKEDQAFAPARSRGGTADASSLHVVPGGAEVRLVLERRSRLKARVVSADGRPLPSSIWVHLDGRENASDGVFDFALRDATTSVVVSAEGFFDLERDVAVKPGEDVDLGTLVMTRSRKARFIVRDEANPGSLAGAPVSVSLSYDGNPHPFNSPVPRPFFGSLDAEGAVDLDGLPFTPIVLTVQLQRDQRSQDVALDASQEVVTVTLPARPR
ncbi:MAG: carboxypeptidase regulatory-like domain-containing protein [Myxococcaceae bacterium]|nr:MAG: carboxypeptidase regulatory-like domain-containing protein [Myxococcaceae bacterium]